MTLSECEKYLTQALNMGLKVEGEQVIPTLLV